MTINPSNRTVEYDLSALLEEHSLTLDDTAGIVPQLLASTQIYTDLHDVAEGNYPFKLAVTNGSADPDSVADAFEFDYELNYEKYDNGDVKPDPTEPEPDPDSEVDKVELNEKINEAAEGVNEDDESTQGDVDAAIADINDAIDGLVEVDEGDGGADADAEVDNSALEKQLADIDIANLAEADYTEASWKTLQDAIKAADFVASDEESTQEEIDEALTALTVAYEGLEEADESTTPEVPEEETEEPGEEQEVVVEVDSDDDSNTLPDTATSTFNWMLGGLMAMFAGGLFTRRGKKSKKNSMK